MKITKNPLRQDLVHYILDSNSQNTNGLTQLSIGNKRSTDQEEFNKQRRVKVENNLIDDVEPPCRMKLDAIIPKVHTVEEVDHTMQLGPTSGFLSGSGKAVKKADKQAIEQANKLLNESENIPISKPTSGFLSGSGKAVKKADKQAIEQANKLLNESENIPINKPTSGFLSGSGKAVKKADKQAIEQANKLLVNTSLKSLQQPSPIAIDIITTAATRFATPTKSFLHKNDRSIKAPTRDTSQCTSDMLTKDPILPESIRLTDKTSNENNCHTSATDHLNSLPGNLVIFKTPASKFSKKQQLLTPITPKGNGFFHYSIPELLKNLKSLSFNDISQLSTLDSTVSSIKIDFIPIIPKLLSQLLSTLKTFPNTQHLSKEWLENQFLLQSWYLLSFNIPSCDFMKCLCKCIYSAFINENSIIKDIIEGDTSPASPMVLMVVHRIDENHLLLTDGFYTISAKLDFILRNKAFLSGQHLYTCLCTCEGAITDVLSNKFRFLQMSANSTKRVSPNTKLGLDIFRRVSISSIYPAGGLLPKITAVIDRLYPLQFYESSTHKSMSEYNYYKRIDELQEDYMNKKQLDPDFDEEMPQFTQQITMRLTEYPDVQCNKELGTFLLQIWHPSEDLLELLKEGKIMSTTHLKVGNMLRTTKSSQFDIFNGDTSILNRSLFSKRHTTTIKDIYFDRHGEFDIIVTITAVQEDYAIGIDCNKDPLAVFFKGEPSCGLTLGKKLLFKDLKYHRQMNDIMECWFMPYSSCKANK